MAADDPVGGMYTRLRGQGTCKVYPCSYTIKEFCQDNKIGIITLDDAVNKIIENISNYGHYTWLYKEVDI